MEGRGCDMSDLPTECVTNIVALTSPGDACRLAATMTALRLVVDTDDVWERFLPVDYASILRRSTEPVLCTSKKKLFSHLCNTPILLDGGKLSFSLERSSGAKRYMLPARALCFGWSGYPYGGLVWSHHSDSRFSEVAILSHVCWLDVYGNFSAKELSSNINYAAYLIYTVDFPSNLDQVQQDQEVMSNVCSHECKHVVPNKRMRSRLWDHRMIRTGDGRKPRARSDGWIELEIKELDDEEPEGEISLSFRGITGSHSCRIVVDGIEIRPKMSA